MKCDDLNEFIAQIFMIIFRHFSVSRFDAVAVCYSVRMDDQMCKKQVEILHSTEHFLMFIQRRNRHKCKPKSCHFSIIKWIYYQHFQRCQINLCRAFR